MNKQAMLVLFQYNAWSNAKILDAASRVTQELRLMKFVTDLRDETLHNKFNYVSTEGFPHERVFWEAMAHLVNHGTQHKTEAAAILTGFGHSPGDIDLIVYLNEAR